MGKIKDLLSKLKIKDMLGILSKSDAVRDVGSVLDTLTPAIGGALLSGSNPPMGGEPNVGGSVLGGALLGLRGGIPGVIFGGLSGFSAAARSGEVADMMRRNNFGDKVLEPRSFQAGGMVLPPALEEAVEVQLEKGEAVMLPDGRIVSSNADRSHEDMDAKDITDILPSGSFVFSDSKTLNMGKIREEDDVIGVYPGSYTKGGKYNKPQRMRLSDVLGDSGEMSFADAARKIDRKIPINTDNEKDIFAIKTNDMNIESRIPHLLRLIELQKRKNGRKG